MNWSERLFDAFMYPLEVAGLARHRRRLLPEAAGTVLEIGAGTGANLRYYDFSRIRELHLSDLTITGRLQREVTLHDGAIRAGIHLREADAQSLPFDSGRFDTVVFTLVFCSVPDAAAGLIEVRRVLKPSGRLLFIEHVRPDHRRLGRAVDVINPAWRAINGDCNINRDTLGALRGAGFVLDDLRTGARGLLVSGIARRAAV